jgi:hypothetical protein
MNCRKHGGCQSQRKEGDRRQRAATTELLDLLNADLVVYFRCALRGWFCVVWTSAASKSRLPVLAVLERCVSG